MMGVKCPRHKAELDIEYTKLNLMHNEYPVVTGQCPVCRIKYLSREIMSSNGSFKVGGQTYQYLSEMEKEYPHPFKPISQQPSRTESESIKKKAAEANAEADRENGKERKEQTGKNSESPQKTKTSSKITDRIVYILNLSYPDVVPKACKNDGEKLYNVSQVSLFRSGTEIKMKAWCCLKCKTAYIPRENHAKIWKQLLEADSKNESQSVSALPQARMPHRPNEPVNLAIPQNVLYVCKGIIACKRNGHTLESATGIMMGRNGSVVKINANYCPQCRKYFIGYDEYEHYRTIYGVLLGNIKVTNGSFVQNETELAEESILRLCGYSVNQTSNLSAAERQRILQYLIDSRISSKAEIMNYLTFFIRRNGKRSNMDGAVKRWNEDLEWVRQYRINQQRYFEICNIQKFKR